MSEFDQRQYRLMLKSLNRFLAGNLPAGKLVADLEGLLNALEEPEVVWKRLFYRYWGHLEEGRALALARGATTLNEQEAQIAFEAANQLKLLVLERIDDIYDRSEDIDWTKQ